MDNMSTVFGRHIGKKSKTNKTRPSDKIYFFQYMQMRGNALTIFDNSLEDEHYPQLATYLAERSNNGLQGQEVANTVRELNRQIRSMPIKISRNKLLLNLPYLEKGECKKNQKSS